MKLLLHTQTLRYLHGWRERWHDMKMKMDARVLRLLFTLGVLLSSSYSLFSPLTIGRGSKNNVEESKITQQLQSNLLQLDQFFQSPTPAARFLTPQTYTPLSFYFLLFSSLLFSSLLFSSLLFSSRLVFCPHLHKFQNSTSDVTCVPWGSRRHILIAESTSDNRINGVTKGSVVLLLLLPPLQR